MREREHGTIEHLLAMPLSAFTILISKVWSGMVVVVLGLSLGLVAIMRVAFGMPFAGSPWLFYVGTLLFLFGTAGLGILIATVARNTPQTALLALLVMTPMIFLSGAYTPEESMPGGLRQAMVISPLKYYTQFTTGLVFRGAGLDTLWPDLAAMAAIGVLVFGLAALRFRAWFAAAQR
jgi:ABC-2 type transport system permease protein